MGSHRRDGKALATELGIASARILGIAIALAQAMSPVVLLGRRLRRATAVSIVARACLVARASSAKVSARASNAKLSAREQWLHWSELSARDRGLVATLLLVLTPLAFNASVASLRAIGPPCVEFDACVAVASLHALRFAVRGAEWCLGVDSHHVACRAHTAMVAGAVLAYQGMQPVAAAMVICVALCVEERHLWSPLGVRTDVETKTLPRSLQPPHFVHASMAHGENNCLPSLRTDDEMKLLLRNLQRPHYVRPALTHGQNNCLIDGTLLALADAGVAMCLSDRERAALCQSVRAHLVANHGVGTVGYPFLSHDEHFHPICDFLRSFQDGLWVEGMPPAELSIVLVVYDRSQRQQLVDVGGHATELPDVPVSSSPAPSQSLANREVIIQLYCNTHQDALATPYHYEWITLSQPAPEEGGSNPRVAGLATGSHCMSGCGLAPWSSSTSTDAGDDVSGESAPPEPWGLVARPSGSTMRTAKRASFCSAFNASHACGGGAQTCLSGAPLRRVSGDREVRPRTEPCGPLTATCAAVDSTRECAAGVEEAAMENVDDSFFEVQVSSSPLYITEQDEHARRCAVLASEFRERPTLPADPGDPNGLLADVASDVRLLS